MTKFVNTRDVLSYLNISRDCLYKYRKYYKDFPKPQKFGRENMFDMFEIERWVMSFRIKKKERLNPYMGKKRPHGVKFHRTSKFIKFWCVDAHNRAWFFENKPKIKGGFWDDDSFGYCVEAPLFEFDGDWQTSLVER